MKIAISGASGKLGQLVITQLKTQVEADAIVALARNPEKVATLGLPAREADYSKVETLDSALEGIDILLLISSNEVGQRVAQHRNVIQAAKKAGVKRVVYTSVLHANDSLLELAKDHHETEVELKASGLTYTFLRNGWYTENYAGAILGALKTGVIVGGAGDGKISTAAYSDFAEAAVTVLIEDGHENQSYELAGDDSFTLSELAAEVSRQTGKEISYKNLSQAEYTATLVSFGLPQPMAEIVAQADDATSQGALFDESHQLAKLIGHPTKPFSVTVSEILS